jgi:hypothetical protein
MYKLPPEVRPESVAVTVSPAPPLPAIDAPAVPSDPRAPVAEIVALVTPEGTVKVVQPALVKAVVVDADDAVAVRVMKAPLSPSTPTSALRRRLVDDHLG